MNYKAFSVYDNEDFFEKYIEKRSKGKSPNELIEQPIMDELIGEVMNKKILDLGCGDGQYGITLLEKNAALYCGIEGSKRMGNLAKVNLENFNAYIEIADIEQAIFKQEEYDMVISRLVFHYIENLSALLNKIHRSIKKEGEIIFSIEHPIITSCYDAYHKKVKRGNWTVDNYFDSGERVNEWIGKKVIKYHKTLEEYWRIIKSANFEVIEIRESKPQESNFNNNEEFERRKRIPLFLFFKLKKISIFDKSCGHL